MSAQVLRYAAFTDSGRGGNPAGVVLDAGALTETQMQMTAEAIGYSETAFVIPDGDGPGSAHIRYFSPQAEVAFCGHATIATAVAIAERSGVGRLDLATMAGPITVETSAVAPGITATLTSPPASTVSVDQELAAEALQALRWGPSDLDPRYPMHIAFAGNHHLIIGLGSRSSLAAMAYDFDELSQLMAREDWTTVHAFWAQDASTFHARNAFPPGGVVEDPATGAAAAAFGGYLRGIAGAPPPFRFTILQGHDMGLPSRLVVDLDRGHRTVKVSGAATRLTITDDIEADLQ